MARSVVSDDLLLTDMLIINDVNITISHRLTTLVLLSGGTGAGYGY